ncbi:MAG: hypothetical protein WAM14_11675 [Candidatus Nitrosopolaris sp.]
MIKKTIGRGVRMTAILLDPETSDIIAKQEYVLGSTASNLFGFNKRSRIGL